MRLRRPGHTASWYESPDRRERLVAGPVPRTLETEHFRSDRRHRRSGQQPASVLPRQYIRHRSPVRLRLMKNSGSMPAEGEYGC